jgi:hypothetical protein
MDSGFLPLRPGHGLIVATENTGVGLEHSAVMGWSKSHQGCIVEALLPMSRLLISVAHISCVELLCPFTPHGPNHHHSHPYPCDRIAVSDPAR